MKCRYCGEEVELEPCHKCLLIRTKQLREQVVVHSEVGDGAGMEVLRLQTRLERLQVVYISASDAFVEQFNVNEELLAENKELKSAMEGRLDEAAEVVRQLQDERNTLQMCIKSLEAHPAAVKCPDCGRMIRIV